MGEDVCIKIKGGLGNQLFQYAFIKSVSKRNGVDFFIDSTSYAWKKTRSFKLNNFDIILNEKIETDYTKHIIEHPDMSFNKEYLNNKNCYFEGYFQNELYFKDIKEELRHELNLTGKLNLNNKQFIFLNKISKTNSVAIFFRRGDYLNLQDIYNQCTFDYYNKSMKYLSLKIENPVYFIFSDDIKWVKENFKINNEHYFVSDEDLFIEEEDSFDNKNDMIDFYLSMNCKHFIITNSTFAWWAAWLSNREKNKYIIFPKIWFTNNKIDNISSSHWYRI